MAQYLPCGFFVEDFEASRDLQNFELGKVLYKLDVYYVLDVHQDTEAFSVNFT